ncbi:MAG: hypothetical protein LBR12_05265, partial [Opitutaceae bacterium]|nr:hypothetical protein [Opitutaceae bacterium]
MSLPAQTSPDDEVVTLQEFQVTSEKISGGYIATEATAGTRFAAKINELPYSVESFTQEMVEDFQLFTDEDMMAFVGGATPATGDTTMRIRGFTVTRTRDGFKFALPGSPSNTKSTE